MKTTVITNIYNEEYYLPFWLSYHKRIFDHGIVVDYCSTDRSMDIVREMCPDWEIRTSRNKTPDNKPYFHAAGNDVEAMDIESQQTGYKIFLNTTEWLIANAPLREILDSNTKTVYRLKPITNTGSIIPSTTEEFMKNGFSSHLHKSYRVGWRFIHNFKNGRYWTGRHFTDHPKEVQKDGATNMYLVWVGILSVDGKDNREKIGNKNQHTGGRSQGRAKFSTFLVA